MIIDAHAHFDPQMLTLDRMIEKMDQAGIEKIALIPTLNDVLPETPDVLLAIVRNLMNSKARPLAEVIHRALLTQEGDLKLDGKVYQIYSRPDNGGVAEAIKQYPDRFYGWIFLNPRNNPNVLEELEYWRAKPGMIGVKFHPHWHDYRTEQLFPVLKRVEELGLPVLIHLGFRKRGDYRGIVQQFPRLVLICAHAGFPFFKSMWPFVTANKNVYVDLSSPFLNESLVRKTVKVVGASNCLYGSDAPFGFPEADHSYDYTAIKGWIERLPVSDQEREMICSQNFLKIAKLA